MNTTPTFEQAAAYLDALDLTYLVVKMSSPDYHLPQWTLEDAKQCARMYKNFLLLQKKYLPKPLVPTREIDEFWHNHILYTRNYTRDCQHIFGFYLHHDPADPKDSELELLRKNFLETKALYLKEFAEHLVLISNEK